MANAEAVTTASDRVVELVGRLQRQEGFDEVVAALKAGHAATLDGVWASSCRAGNRRPGRPRLGADRDRLSPG